MSEKRMVPASLFAEYAILLIRQGLTKIPQCATSARPRSMPSTRSGVSGNPTKGPGMTETRSLPVHCPHCGHLGVDYTRGDDHYTCQGCGRLVEALIIRGPSGVEEKRRCPACGSESQNYSTTYMQSFERDENYVVCGECGWNGEAWEMDEAARAARGEE